MKVPVSRSLENFSFVVMRLPPLHFGAGRQSVSVVWRFCVSGGLETGKCWNLEPTNGGGADDGVI